jgi:hypothetical protein
MDLLIIMLVLDTRTGALSTSLEKFAEENGSLANEVAAGVWVIVSWMEAGSLGGLLSCCIFWWLFVVLLIESSRYCRLRPVLNPG